MALDSLLRAFVNNWWLARRIAKFFAAIGISPNFLSVLSFFFAVLAGLFFFFAGNSTHSHYSFNPLLLLAGVFVCLNSFLDALDGVLARETGNASKKGDFLDHVIDRYSDVFIIGGIIFGGYVSWEIGIVAIIGVLLSSYMGTQAQAVGLSRVYGGLIGRADRLLIIIAATFLTLIYPHPIPASGSLSLLSLLSFPFLGWTIFLFALLCNATALQRFFYAWRRI
jgi:CDP-diacylglycerol--glycerol-3-phosphate 3-phosphatidyltransferase